MSVETETKDLPPTDMLYMTYEGNWQTSCHSKVLSCIEIPTTNGETSATDKGSENNKLFHVCLDQTILHAQGGGQPTDKGQLVVSSKENSNDPSTETNATKALLEVQKVTLDRSTGVATHLTKFVMPPTDKDENNGAIDPSDLLSTGQTVKVVLDQDVRRQLSECHTAGHIVDSAMAHCGKVAWKPTKGYHFLDGPYVEYDASNDTIPDAKDRPALLQELQSAFDELVEQDIATEIELLSPEEADAKCNRQAQNFDMKVFCDPRHNWVRVVTVAGYPCPCGGTHVKRTGELREWGITGLKVKKNVVRVKYGKKK